LALRARHALGALALLGAWAHGPAWADCAPRFVVRFADSQTICLEDYKFMERTAPGHFLSIYRSLPPSVPRFALALPRMPAMCPPAVGLAVGSAGNAAAAELQGRARSTCAASAGTVATGRGEACECVDLVASGSSLVTRNAFERMALGAARPTKEWLNAGWRDPEGSGTARSEGSAPVLTAVAPPAAKPEARPAGNPALATTAGVAAAVVPGSPSAHVPPQSPGTGTGTGAEYAALREQLATIQALVARQQQPSQAAPAAAPPRPARQRVRALVVGNGNYIHLGALPNPPNDARAVADKFRQFGIEVDLVLDADRASLVRALSDYQAKSAAYDVNILFYAGHGLQVDGINYVVPVEMAAAGATAGSVKLNAIALNDALEYLPAKTRVVFLDACRDNPLSRSLRTTRSGAAAGLAPVNTVSGTLVAYATKDGSTAEDGRGRNSPYTEALLRHLDADTDIAIVLRRVRQSVLDSTKGRQEPWEYGSLVGDQLVLSSIAKP
jgi:hypothetical protein